MNFLVLNIGADSLFSIGQMQKMEAICTHNLPTKNLQLPFKHLSFLRLLVVICNKT